jgi:hypothetical protein
MTDMANRLHKLVVPWLLICPPVWAAKPSRASGSTPEAVAGQSRADSTPRITRTQPKLFCLGERQSRQFRRPALR